MNSKITILFVIYLTVITFISSKQISAAQVEKEILKQITSENFLEISKDQRCQNQDNYIVYLIDNFEQPVELIPELTTSHGELVKKILISGRSDIIVKTLNTSLSKGLASVLDDLLQGGCADAVISSIPGSNYSYSQVNTFLPTKRLLERTTFWIFRRN